METDKILSENIHLIDEGDGEREISNSIKSSKPHPIFAGVCDFYIYSAIFVGIVAVLESLIGRSILVATNINNLIIMLIQLVISITLVIVYHSIISKKVSWLSYGERIAGKFLIENQKHWKNPYNINRWGLFFLFLINIIIIGNSFDGAGAGYQFTVPMLIGKFIRFFIVVYGLVMIGQGKFKACLIFIILHVISIFLAYQINMLPVIITWVVIQLILETSIYSIYYVLIKKSNRINI